MDDIFKILVATDNHLGYCESRDNHLGYCDSDPERANDSFNTFEEILQLAVDHNVDFIILGGDLFHYNKPSRNAIQKCMQLLKKYTFGDRPVCFDFVSDPAENFPHLKSPCVNYQDPNLNISLPIFSIHGNHDDPSGLGHYSALDVLSTASLVNYFGKVNDLKEVKISPLLFTKGKNKLALYGLSSIKDERLFRLFKERKVTMFRPKEDSDDWFNILVLHQNHAKHSPTNYIPEHFLDDFLNLVIWGHEHECLINPRATDAAEDSFYVMQPGSSVATSLSKGESVKKQVGILYVNSDRQFRVEMLPLRTVRPFIYDEVKVSDEELDASAKNPVEDYIRNHTLKLIEKSKELLTGHPKQPTKPLIRIKIEYTSESQMFNQCRFGHEFKDSIANHNDIVLFKKERIERKKDEVGLDGDIMNNVFQAKVEECKVVDLVKQYFSEVDDHQHQLHLLSEGGLARAVESFVEKDNKEAFQNICKSQINKTMTKIKERKDFDETKLEEYIYEYYQQRTSNGNAEEDKNDAIANANRVSTNNNISSSSASDLSDNDDINASATTTRGRGKGGRGQNGTLSSRGRVRGRAKGRERATITPKSSKVQPSLMESFFRGSQHTQRSRKTPVNFQDYDDSVSD